MKNLLTILVITIIGGNAFAQPDKARYVWPNSANEGRMDFAYFRYDVTLESTPEKAIFNLYASNLYHLKVNGIMVNMGPLRSFPESPSYDTYDLTPYLQKGKNSIAVKVLRDGVYNFQMPKMPGGFVGWGQIVSGEEVHTLETPGKWLSTAPEAYNTQTPRFSFAASAMEVYDGRKDIKGWDTGAMDATTWKRPVVLKNQDFWGKLIPRAIPHLTQNMLTPKYLMGVYDFEDSEDIYHFQSKVPDEIREDYGRKWPHFAYTYIFSPNDQQVRAGSFWGNFYLNGTLVEPIKETEKRNAVRYERYLNLKAGWNYLFIANNVIWGSWDFYMALPKNAGLRVSADRNDMAGAPIFYVAGPFEPKEETKISKIEVPFEPNELPKRLSADWQPKFLEKVGANPTRDAAWLEFGEQQPEYPKYKTNQIGIPAGQDRALVFDLGRKTLARILLEVDAPEGTVFDVIISEDLNGNKIYAYKRIMVSAGSRFIAPGGTSEFSHFKPYGMRFVQINVRNHKAPVTLKKVAAIEQVYPFDKKGSFTCSDPFFNELWEMGWRTLRVCSEDTYTDTPFRERGLYAGDMLPEFGITQVTSGDPRLLEYSLTFLNKMYVDRQKPGSDRPNWSMGRHNEFPYAALHAWYWSYQTRGNRAFAKEQWQQYKNLIDWSFNNQDEKTGLIWADNVFVEWTTIEKNDTYNTAYNASVVGACRALASVAAELGFGEHKAELEAKAAQLQQSINIHLWDENKGAYWDGINKDGKKMDTYYPISSAFCSLFGVADSSKQQRIIKHYAKILPDIGNKHRDMLSSAYGSFYVLADLFQLGEVGMAEAFYKKYWLPQVEWGDTNFENFKAMEGGGQGTLSHAWSGHATYFLSTQILGVQMGFPEPFNSDTIVISPQSDSIDWAEGTVPHPKGEVYVHWQVKGDNLFLKYSAPKDMKVEIKPRGRLGELHLIVNKSVTD